MRYRMVLILFALMACFTNLLAQNENPGKQKYWIFFTNKAVPTLSKTNMLEIAKEELTPRALRRREKVLAADKLIDEDDLPVNQTYLQGIENIGLKPVVVSRWLNAASYWLTPSERQDVQSLSFVKKLQLVAKARLRPAPEQDMAPRSEKPLIHEFDYGLSLTQNQIIHVPEVHDLGITGKGIWIGILDTGFKFDTQEVFEKLTVIAQRDFINDDDITENEPGQDPPGQQQHGTQTLSVIAGFEQGQLIGPAFDSAFLLAKTEIVDEEIPAEEDYWVAGLEWFESQGVDVVSSSLGYLDFYTPAQMNGKTAVTTIAADIAVSKGVVVVNSAGNEGGSGNPWQIIISPADGFDVIAVGAVTSAGTRSPFSSIGPTADGRIKPDVDALGSSVYTALPSSKGTTPSFISASGTSFSCPAVAGVAALILSAHPDLTPLQVRDALRQTASQSVSPDNFLGWGIINAYQAVLFHGIAFSNLPEVSVNNNQIVVTIKVASKFGINPNEVSLFYSRQPDNVENQIMMSPGPEQNQYSAAIPGASGDETLRVYFSATDSSDQTALQPFFAPDSTFLVINGTLVEPGSTRPPTTFVLKQNYPNPFDRSLQPTTTIRFDLTKSASVSLNIYNILGQRVKTIMNEVPMPAGSHPTQWDGSNDAGQLVSTGIYFYRLQADNLDKVKRMILIR